MPPVAALVAARLLKAARRAGELQDGCLMPIAFGVRNLRDEACRKESKL